MSQFTRRSLIRITGASAAVGVLRSSVGVAADKAVTIGIDLSLTGADAETAVRIRDGFMMAIDEANAKGGADGYHLNVLLLDDGTATAVSMIRRKARPTSARWSPIIQWSRRSVR